MTRRVLKIPRDVFEALWASRDLTVDEIAKLSGCSPRTVQNRAQEWLLPAKPPGRVGLVAPGDLVADAAFATLYNSSMTVLDIADLLGVQAPWVSKRASGLKLTSRWARGFAGTAVS